MSTQLTQEQAKTLLQTGDLDIGESSLRRVKAGHMETKTTHRNLIITLPKGTSYETFLSSLGISSELVDNLEGMKQVFKGEGVFLGQKVKDIGYSRMVHRVAIGGNKPEEVSMPVEPIEKVAGMRWETANSAVARINQGKQK